jgi:hypothetical protein
MTREQSESLQRSAALMAKINGDPAPPRPDLLLAAHQEVITALWACWLSHAFAIDNWPQFTAWAASQASEAEQFTPADRACAEGDLALARTYIEHIERLLARRRDGG